MLQEKLTDYQLILGSGSPRRKQVLEDLNLDFQVNVKKVAENYPPHLQGAEIAEYLAKLKADAYQLSENDLLITGDTIVVQNGNVLGKPQNHQEAQTMLNQLSGTQHEVISSVCIKTFTSIKVFHDTVKVHFKPLSSQEIDFYIQQYQPYDKAGAYGIQEWIGQIGITNIEGSFYTVMGLPAHLLYQALLDLTSK